MWKLKAGAPWFFAWLGVFLVIVRCLLAPDQALADSAQNPPSFECPSLYSDNGVYLGCVNPGQICTAGNKPGTCGDTPNKTNCNCNAAGG